MITRISSANSPMNKIGLQTNKISFGKWDDFEPSVINKYWVSSTASEDSKCASSSYSSRNSSRVNNRQNVSAQREELYRKLRQYADDPTMVRIITQQLENLG